MRVYHHPVPDYATLNEPERRIKPRTLHRINARVIRLAQEYEITQGYKLRLDSSVTASHIHHPTDSSLLTDGVRVVGRLLEWARALLPDSGLPRTVFANHRRSAYRCSRRIGCLSRSGRIQASQEGKAKALRREYTKLLKITRAGLDQAQQVLTVLQTRTADARARGPADQLQAFAALVRQVVDQTVRRVLNGEQVPAGESRQSV